MKRKINITLKDCFLKQHPKYPIIITRWEEATSTDFTFNNITIYNLKLFKMHLLTKMSKNGTKTYLAKLCSVLNLCSDTANLPYNWRSVLMMKADSSQHVYLSKREIKRVFEYIPKTKTERIIQLQFLLGCLTGARKSDYTKFTQSNIQNRMLIYCSKKTGIVTSVPITRTTISIIKELEKFNDKDKDMSDVHFNTTLRNICKNVGIKKNMTLHYHGETVTQPKYSFVSSHTARRSFATNLYIDGIDIYDISKMCGHSNISITERYICSKMIVKSKLRRFFDDYDTLLTK